MKKSNKFIIFNTKIITLLLLIINLLWEKTQFWQVAVWVVCLENGESESEMKL